MNLNCSNLLDLRNLQEQVKKAFCYQKLFWPFTVWINCSSDLKHFANSRPSASNFKSFSRSLEQFFLTVGQNNFGNKIPMYTLELFQTFLKLLFPYCATLHYNRLLLLLNEQQGLCQKIWKSIDNLCNTNQENINCT